MGRVRALKELQCLNEVIRRSPDQGGNGGGERHMYAWRQRGLCTHAITPYTLYGGRGFWVFVFELAVYLLLLIVMLWCVFAYICLVHNVEFRPSMS